MPALTVRDIPDRLYERLRERASRHRRSMSSEIVTLLEETLLPQPVDAGVLIAEAEAVHARFGEPLPDLTAAGKRAGRRYEDPLESADR
ncbi:MAG TPA: Arc family DNA-binding protein [Rhodothermales bacterium]|nr:Arc family DNA-binding protein [Rhodothermales bacterium]